MGRVLVNGQPRVRKTIIAAHTTTITAKARHAEPRSKSPRLMAGTPMAMSTPRRERKMAYSGLALGMGWRRVRCCADAGARSRWSATKDESDMASTARPCCQLEQDGEQAAVLERRVDVGL